MQILLIRHAEMDGDPFVCPPSPVRGCLSESAGVPQAQRARAGLTDVPIDLALSSPYGRALQTAEIVLAGRCVPLKVLAFLREWQPDRALEALPEAQYEQLIERDAQRHPGECWKTELGEGCFDLYARICPPFLQELAALGIHHRLGGFVLEERARALSIAVFAHGGTLNVLLSFLLGVPPFPLATFEFALTGVAMVKFTERCGISYPTLAIPPPRANEVAAACVPDQRAHPACTAEHKHDFAAS